MERGQHDVFNERLDRLLISTRLCWWYSIGYWFSLMFPAVFNSGLWKLNTRLLLLLGIDTPSSWESCVLIVEPLFLTFHFVSRGSNIRDPLEVGEEEEAEGGHSLVHRSMKRVDEISHVELRRRFLAYVSHVGRLWQSSSPHWQCQWNNCVSWNTRSVSIPSCRVFRGSNSIAIGISIFAIESIMASMPPERMRSIVGQREWKSLRSSWNEHNVDRLSLQLLFHSPMKSTW